MLLKISLICLATAALAVAEDQTPIEQPGWQLYTSDPSSVAYTQKLEGVIAKGIMPNATRWRFGSALSVERSDGDSECTRLIWGGDAHTNPLHTQLSGSLRCSDSYGCSITHSHQDTYNWGWSRNPPNGWISGRFPVLSTYQPEPQTVTCNGGPGETICLWSEIQTTAYTVENTEILADGCGGYKSLSILYSPWRCWNRPRYYCVKGACVAGGGQYYETENATGGGGMGGC